MTYGIKYTIDGMNERIRTLERNVEKCELREKQLIIMFKMILDKSLYSNRNPCKITKVKDIMDFMEQLVNKNLPPDEKRESTDLISELIKKGDKIG